MSSIMRARSALTGRSEEWEVIEASSLKPKVAGPSMLGIGCPDRHVLPLTPAENAWTVTHASSRESGFVHGWKAAVGDATAGVYFAMSSSIPSVLLDLDGTLIDSQPGIMASCLAALRALGHEPPEATLDIAASIGPPVEDVMRILLKPYRDDRVNEA